MRSSITLLLVALLAGCQVLRPAPEGAPAPVRQAADLQAEYRALAVKGGRAYRIDPARSKVLIHVFRGGRAAKLGHNHVISVPKFEGFAHLPSDDVREARFDVRVPVAEMVVDNPALRAATGGAFAGERSASDIEGTRRNMLAPAGLDAAQFPHVQLKSAAVAGDWPVIVAEMDVSVRGTTRRHWLMLRVSRKAGGLKVTGDFVLRQSEFGITPLSLFGGVLSVQDAVVIEFELHGAPLGS